MSELTRGRFAMTANANHGGKVCTVKVFDKSEEEGADAAKREFKNLRGLKHERLVSLPNQQCREGTPVTRAQ